MFSTPCIQLYYEAQTLQSECRVRVRHRHLQDIYPTRIGNSNVVSDFKP